MFTGSLSLVLGAFPIFLPTPCPKKQRAQAQQSSRCVRDEEFVLVCHQSIGSDMQIPFRLHCLADNLAWSSVIPPVPYPVISFIVGNLNFPE